MCKSWAVYVPIARSYDWNKFSIVFINVALHDCIQPFVVAGGKPCLKNPSKPHPLPFLLCAPKTARGLALLACCLVCMFLMHFFVVVGGKSDQDFPSKPHPPAFLFFHMGKHACKIYRYFMKISSFENVFFVLFQDVHAISCAFRPSKMMIFNQCWLF